MPDILDQLNSNKETGKLGKYLKIVGRRFGRLVVKKRVENDKWGNLRWLYQCDCGRVKAIVGGSLQAKRTRSCGCLSIEKTRDRSLQHGHKVNYKPTKIYSVWHAMKDRCNNPNDHAYNNYGGRGITVCERWNDFKKFLVDMGEAPKGLTLERKDNGYPNNNANKQHMRPL